MARPENGQAGRKRQEISQIVNALRAIIAAERHLSRELAKRYRITGQQLGALRLVAETPGISLGELSERMYLHISTGSGIVDRLEAKRFLIRERNAEDRRVVHLRVTAEGRQVVKKVPLTGFGRLLRDIDALPSGQVHNLRDGMAALLGLMQMNIETKSKESAASRTGERVTEIPRAQYGKRD